MTQAAKDQMEALGFEVVETGGGCTAWRLEDGDLNIDVTDDADHELGTSCCLSVYKDGEPVLQIGVDTESLLREGRNLIT